MEETILRLIRKYKALLTIATVSNDHTQMLCYNLIISDLEKSIGIAQY
jgi:hypothetical protein